MRTKLLLAALSLLLATGAWALHERDNRLRAEGRAEVAQEAVDSLQLVNEAAERNAELARRRAAAVQTVANRVRAEADSMARVLRARRPALVDTVVLEAGPDSTVVREAVERVAASYEAEISALQRATIAAQATIETQGSLIEALTIENRVKDALIGNLQSQVEAVTRARPGFFHRNTERVAIALAGVAVGYIGSDILGG